MNLPHSPLHRVPTRRADFILGPDLPVRLHVRHGMLLIVHLHPVVAALVVGIFVAETFVLVVLATNLLATPHNPHNWYRIDQLCHATPQCHEPFLRAIPDSGLPHVEPPQFLVQNHRLKELCRGWRHFLVTRQRERTLIGRFGLQPMKHRSTIVHGIDPTAHQRRVSKRGLGEHIWEVEQRVAGKRNVQLAHVRAHGVAGHLLQDLVHGPRFRRTERQGRDWRQHVEQLWWDRFSAKQDRGYVQGSEFWRCGELFHGVKQRARRQHVDIDHQSLE
ncbi:hypothetical protein AMAG_17794 [Allomyces macrogynus ATCC 38327]|uniref:Uncharacterized protein n=1 Tax=Allomyces macrogynus (strain ATCC 38327) TaxID=578462 RepID=A0A0L0RYX4_ALLM3|nr:hypothetical protein AMAG_17794 [Allomyces macrogynus ATCC 38327]|eukprot:KNE55597.1 hypothetical protein AMAG_17794 [Allomyces macrogynus ATCC 38327]